MPVLTLDDFAAALPRYGGLAGLDLGEKTIGVALSDLTRTVASAAETIPPLAMPVPIFGHAFRKPFTCHRSKSSSSFAASGVMLVTISISPLGLRMTRADG